MNECYGSFSNVNYRVINSDMLKKYSKISVITPVYNAEKYLVKTIDSVIKQNIGFNNVQYILVDDGSNDNTRNILLEYAELYHNIIVVFLEENTGTPAVPRNLGIFLSNSEYMFFLDADDWLSPNALRTLSDILDETGDNYVVGKTIQIENTSSKIVGKHESCKERRSVSPYEIKDIFRHLGPRARMIRSELIKENDIVFPCMRFAEDKQFFMDVLIKCDTISTTTKVIYYLNRLDENNGSLTKRTTVFEKIDTNIKVINYIINKKLDIDKERRILNRLYEFDCITRFFYRKHFLNSKEKKLYYQKFEEVLDTAKKLDYDITEIIRNPINKEIVNLFIKKEYQDIVELIKYDKSKEKKYLIKSNEPYLVLNSKQNTQRNIKLNSLALFRSIYVIDETFIIELDIYGDDVKTIEGLVLQKREDFYDEKNQNQFIYPLIAESGNRYKIKLQVDELAKFYLGKYKMFIKYNDYEELYITNQDFNKVEYENILIEFYKTINSNVGLVIK